MNIYKVTQTGPFKWDQYRGFVCITTTENRARCLSPDGPDENGDALWYFRDEYERWTNNPEEIIVELIGTALEGATEQIVSVNFRNG